MAKRRANGEGNIRKRKDGRWEGRYTAGHNSEAGKAIYKNVLGRTQAEVKQKLNAAIEESSTLDLAKASRYTVVQWLEDYAKLSIRPSSHKTYRGFIENHIKPAVGNIPLEKLASMDLQKLYKYLLESGRVDRIGARSKPKGFSVKTVRNINQMISSACNCVVEQRIITMNPTKSCAFPKLEKKEMKILPLDCLNTFFEEAKRSGVFDLYYVDLSTGLRRGELLGLNRRPHIPGQRPAHAPEGAETGRSGENPLPQSPTHLLSLGPSERRGHQNAILHAGPLLRRVHPGHLRPCHHRDADQSRQHRQQLPLRRCPVVSGHFPVWVRIWVKKSKWKSTP